MRAAAHEALRFWLETTCLLISAKSGTAFRLWEEPLLKAARERLTAPRTRAEGPDWIEGAIAHARISTLEDTGSLALSLWESTTEARGEAVIATAVEGKGSLCLKAARRGRVITAADCRL